MLHWFDKRRAGYNALTALAYLWCLAVVGFWIWLYFPFIENSPTPLADAINDSWAWLSIEGFMGVALLIALVVLPIGLGGTAITGFRDWLSDKSAEQWCRESRKQHPASVTRMK